MFSRAHKIQLDPTKAQREFFAKACGTARFVYNHALATWNEKHKAGEKVSASALKLEFNATRREKFPWMDEVHRDAYSQPFANLDKAFRSFFKKTGKHPDFKKKGRCKDSFYVANDKLSVEDKLVRLPKVGWVKMTEALRFEGRVTSAAVSRSADRWFISISVECEDAKLKPKTGEADIGVDLGIKASVTCSDGTVYNGPKSLRVKLRRLKRLSRAHSRKKKGSSNRVKSTKRLAKLHWRIDNARKDFIHKTTTDIARKSQAIAIEDLNVDGMLRNHKLAKALSDEAFGEYRRQFEYKAPAYRARLHLVDRFFPSSKMCSNCGNLLPELKLSTRVYSCDACGMVKDRDVNASENIRNQLGPARPEVTPVDSHEAGGSRNLTDAHSCVSER